MTKALSLALFYLFLCLNLYSQKDYEGLNKSFLEANTDSTKFNTFQDLFMFAVVRDIDLAEPLLARGDSLCSKIQLEHCNAFILLYNGYYYRKSGDYDDAIDFFNLAYSAFEELGRERQMGVCLFNLGVVTSFKGDYEGAVEKYLEAQEIYNKVGNINGLINVNNSLGIIYKNIDEYEKSKNHYLLAVEKAQETDNKAMLAMINNNIANLFYKQIDYPDSVIFYAEKALEAEIELDRNSGIASAHNLISAAYLDKNDYENAIEQGVKALEFSRKSKVPRFIAIHEISLADVYVKDKQFAKAKKYYESGLALADSIKLIDYQIHGHKNYSDLLAEMGLYKNALETRKEYEKYKDTVDIQESKSKIAELEKKYETAIKDKTLKDQELEINKKTYQRNLLFGGFGLSLLLGGSIIWGLHSRNNRNKKITLQKVKLKEEQINNLEKEKKLLSMSSLLEGQESERIRIAKDLHDGLGGLLTSVKAHFGKIQSEIKKVENLNIYNVANEMITKAHDEVRRISHNLMPSDLRVGGLPVAVRKIAKELESGTDLEVVYEIVGLEGIRLEESKEIAIYRILQELVNNSVKYAKASKIFIQLSKFENEVQLVVEDDGIGFNYPAALEASGLGLKSISSRVDQLNGLMDVATSDGSGSSFTINIPLSI